jgi:hypothetical protein
MKKRNFVKLHDLELLGQQHSYKKTSHNECNIGRYKRCTRLASFFGTDDEAYRRARDLNINTNRDGILFVRSATESQEDVILSYITVGKQVCLSAQSSYLSTC